MSGRSAFIKSLREKYNALVIAFTGWAVDPNYRFSMGVDYAFDLSDHCDFNELVELAKYLRSSQGLHCARVCFRVCKPFALSGV